MKKGQIFARAKLRLNKRDQAELGIKQDFKWVNCDIFDLTDESYKIFTTGILFRAGLLTGLKDEFVEGEDLELEVAPGAAYIYKEKLREEYKNS